MDGSHVHNRDPAALCQTEEQPPFISLEGKERPREEDPRVTARFTKQCPGLEIYSIPTRNNGRPTVEQYSTRPVSSR